MRNYTIPENPVYDEEIRMLENTDPADADSVFNPLFSKIINNSASIVNMLEDISDYIGYRKEDIYGVEVDFKNRKLTRLAGAVNKVPGAAFDSVKAFGGRKRCNLTNEGKVAAYFGDAAYSETGKLIQAVNEFTVGTDVQVMVEQPKFYYKIVPLELEKIEYKEVNTIKFTAGCTANGTLGIKLNKVLFNVAMTTAQNTAVLVAEKVRSTTFNGWAVSGSGDSVIFTCNVTGEKVTATIEPASTGITATITKTQPGYLGKGFHMRKARYYISDTKKAGFKLHPAFIQNGVEKNFIYLSAFEGCAWNTTTQYNMNDSQTVNFSTDMLSSIAGAKPMSGSGQSGATRSGFRTIASKRGSGWSQQTIQSATATEMLFLIEYASFNMQEKLGVGNTNKPYVEDSINYSEVTGATTNLGNASGSVTNSNGVNIPSYRGEENFYGNIWKWVDGVNIQNNGVGEAWVSDNTFTDDSMNSPYKNAGITIAKTAGYVSAFAYNEKYDWLFFASETLGNSSLPVGDYFYQNVVAQTAMTVALLGGSWHNGVDAGGFCWRVADVSSYRARGIGGRLVYVPQAA